MSRVDFAITECVRIGRFVYFRGEGTPLYRFDTVTGILVKELTTKG